MRMKRGSGIIMHIASLPGKYGIGTFGKEAYEFADFLKKAGQKYWQILPLGQTSYGDSPYQSFSAFAGNPYFIDFDILEKDGLLNKNDYNQISWGDNSEVIDYGLIFTEKMKVLRLAYENSKNNKPGDLESFEETEADIVYKANINNNEVFFYILIEFQSSVDYRMPIRLLFYMCEILREHAVNANHL